MTRHRPRHRSLFSVALLASLGLSLACKTDEHDIHRWANTQQGPKKIVAVMSHGKYSQELRTESAMTLVRMKPRSGQRVGLEELIAGLQAMSPTQRATIISGMIPRLIDKLGAPLPIADSADNTPVDPSFPYKDAAYALLSQEEPLISIATERARLRAALAPWASQNFAQRMDDTSQTYGMGQLLQLLGPAGVAGLPGLIRPEGKKIAELARFISEFGNDATKLAGSQQLVKVAQDVESPQWLARQTPILRERNKASGFKNVEGERFKSQLLKWQQEEIMRTLASLKKVGQAPIVEFLLSNAEDNTRPERRRAGALAALEGNISRKDPKLLERLVALAQSEDTPDSIRELSLRRIGELPRKLIAESLYKLFDSTNWKVRWLSAELILKTSGAEHLKEFMMRIGKVKQMSITEPIRYGALISNLKGSPEPKLVIDTFTSDGNAPSVRLSALGYYLAKGNFDDVRRIEAFAKDPAKVPGCAKSDNTCEWQCEVGVGANRERKQIGTIGEFVQYCVRPAMLLRRGAKAPSASPTASKSTKPTSP